MNGEFRLGEVRLNGHWLAYFWCQAISMGNSGDGSKFRGGRSNFCPNPLGGGQCFFSKIIT
jgi:hypothetical protein